MSDEFYLQDNRSYVGNDLLFWRERGGYTTNLNEAEVFSKEEAMRRHKSRESDVPWPKEYIDAKTRPAVDMQYVDIKEALKGTGIELIKPETVWHKAQVYNCHVCGRFITEHQNYTECRHCGAENRP